MATTTGQRIGIWVIAVTLTAGTLLGFIAMMIAPGNQATDQKKLQDDYSKQLADYQKQAKAQAVERAKTSRPLEGYSTSTFDENTVGDKVTVETLKNGSGATLKGTETVNVNYFGWTSDGKIFDSSNQEGKTEPVDFALEGGVISGFTDGLTGVKVGSTVRITMPAEKGYGAVDKNDGRPFGPLQFIVEVKAIK